MKFSLVTYISISEKNAWISSKSLKVIYVISTTKNLHRNIFFRQLKCVMKYFAILVCGKILIKLNKYSRIAI